MFRILMLTLLLCVAAPAVVIPERVAAADGKILDTTIDRYKQEAAQWEPRIKQAATSLFWILATVSLVFTFSYMIIRGNTSFGDFFGEFLRFGVTTGFFFWLLENGSAIASAIIKSFGQLGMEASSSYEADLSPSNLISFAIDLVVRACASFSEQSIATGVVALLLAIAIAVLFAIIASMMVLLLCGAWVLVYAGIIYLGFGGGRWTSDIAVNYFKTVLGLAVQTFTFCLLVGIGQAQVERLIEEATQSKSVVVKGYVYDSTITTTSMTITEACIILIFTVVLFMLVKTVPNMVAGVINGSTVGGIQLGGFGAASGLAAAAAGGAMIASQVTGAGLAMRSAYQYAVQHQETPVKDLAGVSSSGGGGLGGAMSRGLNFVGDMAGSLVSGMEGSAKDSLQKSTTGGGVSANIDAQNKQDKLADEKTKADQERKSATQENDGGGDSKSADSTDDDAAPDWDGSISGSSGGSPESAGSYDPWAFGWPTVDVVEDDEWKRSLDSYDPKKVGLPDEN